MVEEEVADEVDISIDEDGVMDFSVDDDSVGLGCVVTLYGRLSTLYRIHCHNRNLYI
jgi:hypothetical protein